MNTQFLKDLGITDQSVIDAIFAENGEDIKKVKVDTERLNSQITELQNQLNERDGQLKELKKSVKDNEELTAKITELETANQNAVNEYNNKIAAINKSHAIESGVRDAKAKNVRAVMALLDMEKITFADGTLTGLTEQLESLQKGEDTNFLFNDTNHNAPVGTNLNNPPTKGGNNPPSTNTLASAIAKALSANK